MTDLPGEPSSTRFVRIVRRECRGLESIAEWSRPCWACAGTGRRILQGREIDCQICSGEAITTRLRR